MRCFDLKDVVFASKKDEKEINKEEALKKWKVAFHYFNTDEMIKWNESVATSTDFTKRLKGVLEGAIKGRLHVLIRQYLNFQIRGSEDLKAGAAKQTFTGKESVSVNYHHIMNTVYRKGITTTPMNYFVHKFMHSIFDVLLKTLYKEGELEGLAQDYADEYKKIEKFVDEEGSVCFEAKRAEWFTELNSLFKKRFDAVIGTGVNKIADFITVAQNFDKKIDKSLTSFTIDEQKLFKKRMKKFLERKTNYGINSKIFRAIFFNKLDLLDDIKVEVELVDGTTSKIPILEFKRTDEMVSQSKKHGDGTGDEKFVDLLELNFKDALFRVYYPVGGKINQENDFQIDKDDEDFRGIMEHQWALHVRKDVITMQEKLKDIIKLKPKNKREEILLEQNKSLLKGLNSILELQNRRTIYIEKLTKETRVKKSKEILQKFNYPPPITEQTFKARYTFKFIKEASLESKRELFYDALMDHLKDEDN